MENHGVTPHLFLETASNRANVSMVRKGLSCSIVPYYYVKDNRDVLRFRLAGAPSWTISVCCRRNRYLTKAARHFIRLAQDYFQREMSDPW